MLNMFKLDEFQIKAISAIDNHKNVLITAPTGSGKTLPAEHAITKFCKQGKKVIYTSPVKALSNQKCHDFSEKFPDISFGLITGDNSTNVDADCLIMTTEILHNTLHQMKIKTDNPFTLHFEMDIHNELACVIYDEVHYINDPQRGGAWEGSMSMLPEHVVQVMLSATISRPEKIPNWFRETLNQEVVLCHHTIRSVPLRHHCFTVVPDSVVKKIKDRKIQSHFVKYVSMPLEIKGKEYNVDAYRNTKKMVTYLTKHNIRTSPHFALQKICEYLLKNNLLPGISFILSRKMIEKMGNSLHINLHTDEKIVHTAAKEAGNIMRRFANSSEYTSLEDYKRLVKMFERGIAIHHSGMLPVFRELVEIMFEKGYVKMLLATETFAIGMNMPTKTVVFTNLSKFDGREFRYFYPHEYTQAAGRAGRRGKDTIGHVFHLNSLFEMPTEHEYQQIMCNRGDVMISKYSIDLKTVLNMSNKSETDNETNKTNEISEHISKSMMGFEIRGEISELKKELEEHNQIYEKLNISLQTLRTPENELQKYVDKKEIVNNCSNKQRKKIQRELSFLENTHKFISRDYSKIIEHKQTKKNIGNINSQIINCEQYIYRNVRSVQEILQKYLLVDDKMYITELGKSLSHMHEINPCVFSKIISILDQMDIPGIISVFSCFISDKKSDDKYCEIPLEIEPYISQVKDVHYSFIDLLNKRKLFFGREEVFDTSFIKHIYKWYQSENTEDCISVLKEYLSENDHFVGQFVKKILKIVNIARESQKMCETCENLSLLTKIKEIEVKLLKSIVTTQSLYF
jgi:superfamily II RNA helicase